MIDIVDDGIIHSYDKCIFVTMFNVISIILHTHVETPRINDNEFQLNHH